MIANRQGAWLRVEPSHLSLSEVIELPVNTAVRVIGKPAYEADPGQWWWLVSADDGAVGWVEEISLAEP